MSQFTVVYDANVLYPLYLRDLLLRLATTGLFRARWTTAINEEWKRSLLANKPAFDPAKIDATIQKMNAHALDCLIEGYEHLIPCVGNLPDPNDRHVVAAAMHGGAELIVTSNLKDFPADALDTHGIEAIHPDDFILELLDLNPAICLRKVQEMRAPYKNPPLTQDDLLRILMKLQLPQTVSWLERYKMAF